jgi:tetratricopeptide (TPR) repeat protein
MLLIFFNGKSQEASTLYIKGKDALKTNTSKAFNILDSAQTIADKAQNTNLSIKTRKLKGYAKYYEGDFSNAILAFGQTLEISKINDSTALQFDLCNALGACYKFVGDYGKSINYFNDAYQKALVLNDTGKVAKSTNNLGLSYSSIDSLKKARVYYNNSLRLKSLKGKTVSYAKTLNNIGLTEQLLKDYKKAQAHFEEAILVAEQANNLYQMASFKINLLDLQIGQNNTFNQKELLNGLEKTILSNGFVDLKPRLYLLKSNFAFTQKNYQKAIDFRDIYYKIQDSLYTEESKSAIANAKLIKEIEEKKNENLILSQQNLIQGLELKQKQLTNTVVFIGLVLLALVSILLYLRFNRLKKLYQKLNKQENLLIKEKNAAQKANNYKSEFLANMSHEIRAN